MKKKHILGSAKGFILLCAKHMKMKLPFNDEELSNTRAIFFEDDELKTDKLNNLKLRFPNIVKTEAMRQNITMEIEQLEFSYGKVKSKYVRPDLSIIEVWKNLEEEFPNLSILARALCVLPHSTVDLERIFSKMKEIKTSKRNRLTVKNLEACLLSYQFFAANNICIKPPMVENYIKQGKESDEIEIIAQKDTDPKSKTELENNGSRNSIAFNEREVYGDNIPFYIPKGNSKKTMATAPLKNDEKKHKSLQDLH